MQFTNEQLIELAKGCQKLIHVEIYFNFAISAKGITDGLFAHCPCIETLVLCACLWIKDTFFNNLPATLKRLEIELGEVVSIFVTPFLFASYTSDTYIIVILFLEEVTCRRQKEVEKNNTNSGYELDSLRGYYLLFATNIATNSEIKASGISRFNW